MSDDILRNICFEVYSFERPVCNSILGSAHIDARDGYPQKMLKATYIIITDPIQYHKLPQYQQTIAFVSRFVHANQEKYQLVSQNTIENGIKVEIYKNIITINKNEITGWNDLVDR